MNLFYKYKPEFKIVPTILHDRKVGSKAFRLKNSILVVISIIKIFIYEILKIIVFGFSRLKQ